MELTNEERHIFIQELKLLCLEYRSCDIDQLKPSIYKDISLIYQVLCQNQ